MTEGAAIRKLQYLAANLHERAKQGTTLSVSETEQVAGTIDALLPWFEAMGDKPVPQVFRVVQGSRGGRT